MRTKHSPPPVHVHVVESTPVHVHMRRSPSRTPQTERSRDVQARADRGRATSRAPWIPPGISSCRRDQRSRAQSENVWRESDEQDDDATILRKNLSLLLKEQQNSQRTNKGQVQSSETEVLLRALVEAEVDGVAVANQLTSFKETLDSLAKDKHPSKLQTSTLTRRRQLLTEKMEIFDNTNHSLRDLLRDWSHHQREAERHSEENEAFKSRLADVEAENIRLVSKLSSKEKEASQLTESLNFEKEHAKTTEELSRILASTRDHLESQLSRVQDEKVTMAAQLQQAYEQRRENDDEAALALLTQHAEQAEEASRQMGARLQEKESQLAQALSTCSELRLRIAKEATARSQLEDNITALKLQVSEWNAQHHMADERSRGEREELRDQLHRLSAEKTAMALDKQSLKAQVTSGEEKLRVAQEETRQLMTSYKKLEAVLDKYKRKAQQADLQCEEQRLKVNEAQLEAREAMVAQEREQEQLRKELLRLRQLETLPERLRRSEQQLAQVQQEADDHQRRNLEHNATLAEVRHKVEQQGSQLEVFQRRNMLLQEENNVLKEKILNLERKLESMRVGNQEMCEALSLKEVSVLSVEQQLDQKSRENAALTQQLQQALEDAQQQARQSVERVLDKERRSQSKALDLQEQLSRAEAQLSQLHRSKEEMERRFQNQLKNLKERLDQSDQTNRSLQNYVRFLKTSYGNVFGEPFVPS
ncbi:outer dense fiber protein 2-like isoform X2 [Phyllopteryx taeniolatus]|uniref:outer dense fiber protein 2-like isoform X2 n=1 Tax=Phyllopteryx taeniolatus TaxID=161469 RepID=UPI002AD44065|nr:outer dense fiber protein 2-like isoform X2 [Phyllopteryx taeniolatus]